METEPCKVSYDYYRDPRPVPDAQGRTRIICFTHGLSVYSDAFAAGAQALQKGQAERRMYDAHLRHGVETKAHNVTVVKAESHGNWGPLTGIMYVDEVRETKMAHNVREGAVCWIGVWQGQDVAKVNHEVQLFEDEKDAIAWQQGEEFNEPRTLYEVTLRGVKEMEVVPAQLAVRKPR